MLKQLVSTNNHVHASATERSIANDSEAQVNTFKMSKSDTDQPKTT